MPTAQPRTVLLPTTVVRAILRQTILPLLLPLPLLMLMPLLPLLLLQLLPLLLTAVKTVPNARRLRRRRLQLLPARQQRCLGKPRHSPMVTVTATATATAMAMAMAPTPVMAQQPP